MWCIQYDNRFHNDNEHTPTAEVIELDVTDLLYASTEMPDISHDDLPLVNKQCDKR